ncbi:hypothetical protein [Brevibacterium album]|uniref:hypothetical protein n=1 Tax=Brevibacterium album TaxID=417948 RepID=UPI00040E5BC0|nr:hypothetical protein [Brevibacterium album]
MRKLQGSARGRACASLASVVAALIVLAGCVGDRGSQPEPESSADERTGLRDSATEEPAEFAQDFGSGEPIAAEAGIGLSAEPTGARMTAENVGISFEATDLADPRLDPTASTLDERLRELGSPALRFGGNRLDRNLFWTSSGEAPPPEESVTVGPNDLRRLARLIEATGSTVTLGLPLGTFEPDRAADMAAYAQQILGDALLAVAVGNEPNGYTVDGDPNHRLRPDGWDVAGYQEQLRAYEAAIEERAPGLPLVGPDAYDGVWMRGFAESGIARPEALAQHWYALYECESAELPGRGPLAANLVSPLVREAAAEALGIGLDAAEAANLPLWIEEAGPTSCPGTNDSSRTQAQALWTVDFALHAASLGAERLALHSALAPCRGGPPMSVVCAGEEEALLVGQEGHAGLRLAALSAGGEFVEVEVTGGGEALRAYGVRKAGGRLVLTVMSTADAAEVSRTPVRISAPEGYRAVEAAQVSADSLAAVSQTRFTPPAPLPEAPPYSGAGAGSGGEADPGGDSEETLRMDLDASAATVIVFERG